MKTRSNMPLFVVECEDVKALSNAQIDLLRCGDYLVKKDASGEHAYKVTFKSDTGMCITYHDASVIETQSYDKIDGIWTYNSEDKSPVSPDGILDELEDKDLVAKTLLQKEPNYEANIDVPTYTGFTSKGSFFKMKQYANELHIIYNEVIQNTSGASANVPGGNITINDLPDEIADKIFDMDGKKLTEAPSSLWSGTSAYIRMTTVNNFVPGVGTPSTIATLIHSATGQLQIQFSGSGTAVPDEGYVFRSCEVNLIIE